MKREVCNKEGITLLTKPLDGFEEFYNTIHYNCSLISPFFLVHVCQAQKCTFTPRRHRCNCNAEHCGRGTCSRSLRGGQSGNRTRDPPDDRHRTPPSSHNAPTKISITQKV